MKSKSGINLYLYITGFPDGSVGKESACNAGDTGNMGSIPGSERSPGEENDKLLQCSCLENPKNKGAWQDIVHEVTKQSDTTEHST